MNKLNYFLLLFTIQIFSFSIISCAKDEEKGKQLYYYDKSNVESRSDDKGKHINCISNCPQGECYSVINPETWVSRCVPCSDCKLQIVYSSRIGSDVEFKTDMTFINKIFLLSIKKEHPESWQVYKIFDTYFDKSDFGEFIQISYEINSKLYTKSYVAKYDQDGILKGPIIEVDCFGDCGSNSGNNICTENWDINNGKVTCACESDNCKMRIEVKE